MLGELISEGTGRRNGRRVVAVEPRLKVEVSFEAPTTLIGLQGLNINDVAGAFEFEVASDGTTRARIWEWK